MYYISAYIIMMAFLVEVCSLIMIKRQNNSTFPTICLGEDTYDGYHNNGSNHSSCSRLTFNFQALPETVFNNISNY